MAMIDVYTTAGRALLMQAQVAQTDLTVALVKVGTGHVATAAAARALVDIVTPFLPVREFASPPSFAGEDTFQVSLFAAGSDAFTVNEIGVFVGATMVRYICDDGGAAVFSKPVNAASLQGFVLTFEDGEVRIATVDYVVQPVATTHNYGLVRLGEPGDAGAVVLTAEQIAMLVTAAGRSDSNLTSFLNTWWSNISVAAAKLSGIIRPSNLPYATTEARGAIERATVAEVRGGGTGGRAITDEQIVVYNKGAVPAAIPSSVAIYFERE